MRRLPRFHSGGQIPGGSSSSRSTRRASELVALRWDDIGRCDNYEASKMVVKFVTKNGSRITSIAAMRTAPSLSRVELMTLKGRSPKHCSGSHRKNSAVLEALFETPTDADHRCINLSQRGSHHQ